MSARILIVEDDKVNNQMLSSLIQKIGFTPVSIFDAHHILEEIQKNNIELILLDIIMPEVDGYEALKLIREKYDSFELPVIMISANNDSLDIVKALELGASDYIVKPAEKGILKARIETQLKLREFHKLALDKKEIDSIKTMIATYNHEINNPLAIAVGCLSVYRKKEDKSKLDELESALKRITEIVKKIQNISVKREKENYSKDTKTFKL